MPRSGTTWVANALGRCAGTVLVHEPDNDRAHPAAFAAKASIGRFPLLAGDDRAPGLAGLLRGAFGEGRWRTSDERRRRWALERLQRAPVGQVDAAMRRSARVPLRLDAIRRVGAPPLVTPPGESATVVKSVHLSLALEWVADQVVPDEVLVIWRHPANVIGSWRELGAVLVTFPWEDERLWARFGPPAGAPGPGAPDAWIDRAAWMFALLANAQAASVERHRWPTVDHEDLLASPADGLADLAERLGLGWTDEAHRWVLDSDRPGAGYDLGRVAAEQRDRWRTRLTPDELAAVADVLGRFPALADRWDLRG